MNRRNFLRTLVGGVAGAAAVRTWPFRVYSFPSKIVIPRLPEHVFPCAVSPFAPKDAIYVLTPAMLKRAHDLLRSWNPGPTEWIVHPEVAKAYGLLPG